MHQHARGLKCTGSYSLKQADSTGTYTCSMPSFTRTLPWGYLSHLRADAPRIAPRREEDTSQGRKRAAAAAAAAAKAGKDSFGGSQ